MTKSPEQKKFYISLWFDPLGRNESPWPMCSQNKTTYDITVKDHENHGFIKITDTIVIKYNDPS